MLSAARVLVDEQIRLPSSTHLTCNVGIETFEYCVGIDTPQEITHPQASENAKLSSLSRPRYPAAGYLIGGRPGPLPNDEEARGRCKLKRERATWRDILAGGPSLLDQLFWSHLPTPATVLG